MVLIRQKQYIVFVTILSIGTGTGISISTGIGTLLRLVRWHQTLLL